MLTGNRDGLALVSITWTVHPSKLLLFLKTPKDPKALAALVPPPSLTNEDWVPKSHSLTTRKTSSIDVIPCAAWKMPSSSMVSMPSLRA